MSTSSPQPLFHVVLVEPEIPANTGNIARLCANTGAGLHLIRPLGFHLTDRHLRRAGLDYWSNIKPCVHDSWPDYLKQVQPPHIVLVETGGSCYTDHHYPTPCHFVFGSETRGLPSHVFATPRLTHAAIPMRGTRSLNLANSVAVIVYEAWRQQDFH